ncbi:hypothetical protein DE146DRAFT_255814 [Phaeosphaeria sp. MPI-PUGE-AT-0046c]|nr:hypothetical protein DE146DRAFT_255814 [Phaeosphaeria sp. MPI-PUGE-AT-0046c]
MFGKFFITSAMALLATAADSNSTSSDLATQIIRVGDLTRIAYMLHRDVVEINNDASVRHVTVATLDAIANQALAYQEMNNSPTAKRATYTEAEQSQIAEAYADYMSITTAMLGAAVDKHFAVVSHNAGHTEGAAMNYSMAATKSWSEGVLASIPAQKSAMTVQKAVHDNTYQMTVDLYLNGPAGLA